MGDLQKFAKELLAITPGFSQSALKNIVHICGDASGRRYFRLHLTDSETPTLILMLLNHSAGPPSHAGGSITQDDTFVELSTFFRSQNINVPPIYLDMRTRAALLVGDMGDNAIWQFAFNKLSPSGQTIKDSLGKDAPLILFKKAVDVLADIQACRHAEECIAFKRYMSFEEYRVEAERFVSHFLMLKNFPESEIQIFQSKFDELCETIAGHPQVLMHRDYMPWNIHISQAGEICVLDFQDALRGSSAYDLAALINDRDIDFALGKEYYQSIVNYYRNKLDSSEEFNIRFHEAILQRYFRLAGQFEILSEKFSKEFYRTWIPGCLKRLGRSLAVLKDYSDLLEILASRVPEVKEGSADPWII
jgi:N-acetylmuramate 1-kinase